MVKIIFQDDGNGPYLRPDVTPEELAAWEAANRMKWENRQLVPMSPTLEQIQVQLTQAVQNHLDSKAREKTYRSMDAACTYDGDPNPVWNAEGKAYKAWRSQVWLYCIQVMADVQNGLRPIPTEAELLAELPVFGGV